ncbi:MAG: methionyl-tRNA formyltransferase [Thermoanaerobaculaceae bacterium]|jgi:methionyl-tRNA formyltransferase|nr:methionyl-tRNA formyltransferase [Thermoanaerobaculaceae bacterium]
MRIVFFGTPDFAVPSLRALVEAGHEVALVVSRPDKPAGRRLRVATPPVVAEARRLGLAVTQPAKLSGEGFAARLREVAAEVAVVVAYGRLIPAPLLAIPRWGFVNLHPSLLPRHRGPSPIQWAIASGDSTTGVSTMLLDEGMDTGPILLQRPTAIGPGERALELERRLAELGAELVVATLAGLEAGTVRPQPQDHRLATVTPKLERSMGRVDWHLTAQELERRCRAFDPWPGLYCTFRGGRLKVHGLEVGPPLAGTEPPGTVVAVSASGISVRCGSGTVALLTELQREGRRRLPADAFILGERVARGERMS